MVGSGGGCWWCCCARLFFVQAGFLLCYDCFVL